jgi:hypothetical protein
MKNQEIFKLVASSVIGVLLLFGIFWYMEFDEFATAVKSLQINWVILSVVAMVSIYFMRSLRWQLLLKPVKGSTNLSNILAITIVGLFVNALIPIRIGEFLRAFLLREREGIKFFAGFSSIVSERIFDLLGIAVLGIMATFTLPSNRSYPSWFLGSLRFVALLMITAILCLLIGVKNEEKTLNLLRKVTLKIPGLSEKWKEKILGFVKSLIAGFKGVASRPVSFMFILIMSGLIWITMTIVFYSLFLAFNLSITWSMILLGCMLIQLSLIFPAAPGRVGTYEAAWTLVFVAGLGFTLENILPIAIISHLLRLFVIASLGCISTVWLGLNFKRDILGLRKNWAS